MTYRITAKNIHIKDSCSVPKKEFRPVLASIKVEYGNTCLPAYHRSIGSMSREWATHNALHALGLWKDRTSDVDLNWPQRWWVSASYNVIGFLVWPFIK